MDQKIMRNAPMTAPALESVISGDRNQRLRERHLGACPPTQSARSAISRTGLEGNVVQDVVADQEVGQPSPQSIDY